MKTITIQIGNSDDKLTQKEWAEYVKFVGLAVETYAAIIYFSGFSLGGAPWQNAAWVLTPNSDIDAQHLRRQLSQIRVEYRQDSIAWTEGQTDFI